MSATIIIPARLGSTRLPRKLLLPLGNKPLIQHTWERAKAARHASRVVIAVDDPELETACRAFGADIVTTDMTHTSGTARIAEAAQTLGLGEAEIIVNVQGDEPELDPAAIDAAITTLTDGNDFAATLATPFATEPREGPGSPADSATVKVAIGKHVSPWRALYFSRAPIPYDRNGKDAVFYLHIGLYVFRQKNLQRFARWPQSPMEKAEGLEQLRILEHGETISVGITEHAFPGIDTEADYAAASARLKP